MRMIRAGQAIDLPCILGLVGRMSGVYIEVFGGHRGYMRARDTCIERM